MSAIHEFKCNSCGARVKAQYNGEHYLFPADWVELYDIHKATTTGEHLCNKCRPKRKKKK